MKRSASLKRLTTLAMLAALSVVLVAFIHFPLFPTATFFEYDPADIPIFIGTFLFGPGAGLLLTAVVCVVQGTTVSAAAGIIGIIMHFAATGSFVLLSGNIYKRRRTRGGAIGALVAGVLVMTGVMVLWNLLLTPIYMGMPIDKVIEMMLPIILPFNLLKAGMNAVATYVVYKPVSRILRAQEPAFHTA